MWWDSFHLSQGASKSRGIVAMYDEVWAVDADRIRAFFRDHSDEVTVIPLPERMLGSMVMPQTRIIISGDDADKLYHRFYLAFVTAGG